MIPPGAVTVSVVRRWPVMDDAMNGVDDRLLDLVDSVTADEERLPLLTLGEARAAVELLQRLADGRGDGAFAARQLAGKLARRLPADG
ncbi:hypothetical protein [Streptomyces sp. NPDC050355]|uniref:hypothetical protein n=1 Tax=Streptomyces sp. NPDC050355 TaxID=3365609 RepID=UPI0037997114